MERVAILPLPAIVVISTTLFTLVGWWRRPARGLVEVGVTVLALSILAQPIHAFGVQSASFSAGFGRRAIEPAEVLAADLTGQAVLVLITTAEVRSLANTSLTIIVNNTFYTNIIVRAERG